MPDVTSIDLHNPGVYLIRCLATDEEYVGSTAREFIERFGVHRRQLNAGIHKNRRLQAAWKRYGKEAFVFQPLVIVAEEDALLRVERREINKRWGQKCFNQVRPRARRIDWRRGG